MKLDKQSADSPPQPPAVVPELEGPGWSGKPMEAQEVCVCVRAGGSCYWKGLSREFGGLLDGQGFLMPAPLPLHNQAVVWRVWTSLFCTGHILVTLLSILIPFQKACFGES